jgi:ketosteroid isomerase-like protein
MSEHPNVELLRRGFAAFAQGDMATLDGLFADDAAWHVAGRNRFSGDYKGKAAIFQYFGEFIQAQDTFEQDIHALFADDDHGVALVKSHAKRGNKRLEGDTVLVFHIAKGQVTETWVVSTDPYAGDEFWA